MAHPKLAHLMSDDQSTADLLRMLKGIAGRNPETPAEGFYPTKWWAKEWGLDISKAREYISKGVDAGVVEHRDYLISNLGVRRKVPHYKINKLPKNK